VDDVVKIFALLGMSANILFQKWNRREIPYYSAFLLLCILTYLFNKETDVLVLAILILSSKNTNIYKLAKLDVVTRSVCLCLTLLCYALGFLTGYNMEEPQSYFGIRYSLGYSHPNNLFTQVFLIVVGIILVNRRRLRTKHYLLLILFNVVFGIITYSRTGMTVLTLLIVLVALRNRRITEGIVYKFLAKNSFWICGVFTMIAIYLYNDGNALSYVMDTLASGRLSFASRIIEEYGIGLWGKDITYVSAVEVAKSGGEAIVLDSMYPYLLVTYGVIFTVFFLYLISRTQKVLLRNNEEILCIVIICFAIYSISQRAFLSVNNNFTIITLSYGIKYLINHRKITQTAIRWRN